MTVVPVVLLALGCALVLDRLPWFRDRALVERLRPYAPGAGRTSTSSVAGTARSVAQVLLPTLDALGAHLARAVGVETPLARRLERAAAPTTPEQFRVRQATHAVLALLAVGALTRAVGTSAVVTLSGLLAAPVLAALLHEQQLSRAIEHRRGRIRAELPVVVEQLGTLLGAGYSLPGALARLCERADGAVADELRQVARSVGRGSSVDTALDEWAERSDLEAVRRLVHVLALHADASNLATLVAEEARSLRAESHRELLAEVERRSQLVWIPVTVATLVPGLLFLAVPFLAALSQVAG
jgi:Flp pilus assembly protein TadB